MKGTIAIAGAIAQRPGFGGHAWVFLQYLLGFRRLGWDVLFLDRMDSGMGSRQRGVRYLEQVLGHFGLDEGFSVLDERGASIAGLPRPEVLKRLSHSPFLLNVMGYLDDEEILAAAPQRVFLDIDPGFGQMWCELGLANPFDGHDAYVTIAENIGRSDCLIPTCGLDWITSPQPVVLDEWPAQASRAGSFTSIGSWRGPYGPVEYEGTTYGLRVHEFRRFVELPRRSEERFELALEIDSADEADLTLLTENGWVLLDPEDIARDPTAYRSYIRSSKAELMVAKSMYVKTRSGWFSDRSICFLASGKPVLAQDTGLDGLYPTGEGLLVFSTLEEAVAGVEEISDNYSRHARAARALAEERFDSDKVLPALLQNLGVSFDASDLREDSRGRERG